MNFGILLSDVRDLYLEKCGVDGAKSYFVKFIIEDNARISIKAKRLPARYFLKFDDMKRDFVLMNEFVYSKSAQSMLIFINETLQEDDLLNRSSSAVDILNNIFNEWGKFNYQTRF